MKIELEEAFTQLNLAQENITKVIHKILDEDEEQIDKIIDELTNALKIIKKIKQDYKVNHWKKKQKYEDGY